jgi:glycosyltransferase involved in cell wall biosynthesis
MKKVLIISYYWPPSGGGGVQRWLKLANYLKEFSVDPIVLTVDSKYASYPHIDEHFLKEVKDITTYRTKSFEALKVYGSLFGKKNVPHSAFANVDKKSPLQTISRFIRGNMFVPDPRKGWNKYAIKEAKKIIAEHGITTIITTSPPHSTQLIGLQLKKELSINWIADLRDPWTDIFYYKDLLHLPFRRKKDIRLEKEVLQNADQIITVSNSLKQLFADKLTNSSKKIHVIPNGFDPKDFEIKSNHQNSEFTFGYIGSLTEEYSPQALFSALQRLKKYKFKLKFIGNVSPGIIDLLREYDLESHCVFKDRVAHDQAVIEMKTSDALLLLIPEVENNEGILTGKIFEYIASRKPIIGIGPENGDASKILAEFSQCKMFDYQSNEIAAFIKQQLDAFYEGKSQESSGDHQHYSRKHQAGEIADLIKAL